MPALRMWHNYYRPHISQMKPMPFVWALLNSVLPDSIPPHDLNCEREKKSTHVHLSATQQAAATALLTTMQRVLRFQEGFSSPGIWFPAWGLDKVLCNRLKEVIPEHRRPHWL